jgi:hypothetical protein
MPATTVSARVHLVTGKFEFLSSLPKLRYALSVELVVDPMDPAIKHLHTDHCRLKINEQNQNLQDAQ